MAVTELPSGRSLPLISYNGNQVASPEAFQKTYENDVPFTYFDVQSYNVVVVNPQVTPLDASAKQKEREQNISLLLQVSGSVRLLERKEGPIRGFSDQIVLVPNTTAARSKAGGRAWVVQSQNFRFVV